MADHNHEPTGRGRDSVRNPAPVTPSRETERPEGLAFDVEEGTALPGVPVGDQAAQNPGAAPEHESGGGVGLALPGDHSGEEKGPDRNPAGQR